MGRDIQEAPPQRAISGRRASGILLIATFAAGAANYLFSLICIRWVGTAAYPDVASVSATVAIATLPFSGLQAAYARAVARASSAALGAAEHVRMITRTGFRQAWHMQLGVCALAVAVAPWSADVLHLQDARLEWFIPFAVFGGCLVLTASGVLQGLGAFAALAMIMFLSAAVKVLFVAPAIYLGGAAGAVIVLGVAGLVTSVISMLLVWRRVSHSPVHTAEDVDEPPRVALSAGIWGLLAYSILANFDLVIVQTVLSTADAADYAGALLIGKAAAYVAAAVSTVLLTSASRRHAAGRDARPILYRSLRVVAAMGLVFILIAYLIPDEVYGVILGSESSLASLVAMAVGVMTIVGMVNIAVNYMLAHDDIVYVRVLVALAIAYAASVVALVDSPGELLAVMASGSILALVAFFCRMRSVSVVEN